MTGRRAAKEYRFIASPRAPDTLLPAKLLATAEGYAMVRRPGAYPFVVTEEAWDTADVVKRGEKS